jgi:hypothetical protein
MHVSLPPEIIERERRAIWPGFKARLAPHGRSYFLAARGIFARAKTNEPTTFFGSKVRVVDGIKGGFFVSDEELERFKTEHGERIMREAMERVTAEFFGGAR